MTTTIQARFDGHVLVPLGPVDLPCDRTLILFVQEAKNSSPQAAQCPWPLLNLRIDPELANAIALDPEFNIEES